MISDPETALGGEAGRLPVEVVGDTARVDGGFTATESEAEAAALLANDTCEVVRSTPAAKRGREDAFEDDEGTTAFPEAFMRAASWFKVGGRDETGLLVVLVVVDASDVAGVVDAVVVVVGSVDIVVEVDNRAWRQWPRFDDVATSNKPNLKLPFRERSAGT